MDHLEQDVAGGETEMLCDQLQNVAGDTELHHHLSNSTNSLKSATSFSASSPSPSRLNNSQGSAGSTLNTSGSNSSLNSHRAAEDKHVAKDLSGSNKGDKLVQEEILAVGKVSQHVYLLYARAIGVLFTIASVVAFILSQVSYAGSNVWLAQWSSEQSNHTHITSVSRDTFLLVYGVFAFGQSFFLFLGILTLALGTLRAANSLHSNLLKAVVRLPMSFFDTNPSGRIMNRFCREINKVDNNLPWVTRTFFTTLLQVVTTLVVVIAATPAVAFMVVPVMLVYFVIQRVFVATSRQLMRLESISKSPIYSHFNESIAGVSVIRAFKRQDEFFSQSLQNIENSQKSTYAIARVNSWLGIHLETIGNLITFAAAVVSVSSRSNTTAGAVGLSISYALSVTTVLNWLVRIVSSLEASIVSVEKIDEYVQLPQEAAWRVEKSVPPSSWPEKGAIEFHNFETRYRPGLNLVLQDVTCCIRPAEKVGVVGRTGAGKSSLTMALFRIIEASGGRIDVDDLDIGRVGLHDLRRQISIIPQDAVLFSGSLRMNLDPLGQHCDDELWRALELSHLSDYIHTQPLGLNLMVDQGGSNFSAGQKQLLCLARALLRHSPVLVLDEATAAVDLHTDELIQATIRTQFAACTVITIAHRLNTVMDSDRVMVLHFGRIAEFDAPSVLLQQPDSVFYRMAKDAGIVP